MKKMMFMLSNILFLGIPYLMVKVLGGLTPDERELTFDKVKPYQASLKLEPFADEGKYNKCLSSLFPDEQARMTADRFLVTHGRRYHFSASQRQADLIDDVPEDTLQGHYEDNGVVEVFFGDRSYNSIDHVFCHTCRTPMLTLDSWGSGPGSCANCGGVNTTPLSAVDERLYVSLLKEFDKAPPQPVFDNQAKSPKARYVDELF